VKDFVHLQKDHFLKIMKTLNMLFFHYFKKMIFVSEQNLSLFKKKPSSRNFFFNLIFSYFKNMKSVIICILCCLKELGKTEGIYNLLYKHFSKTIVGQYLKNTFTQEELHKFIKESYQYPKCCLWLLQENIIKDPSINNNNIIIWASSKGYLEVVKQLLKDKRVDPSDKNNNAIRWASAFGYLEIVKLLLEDKRVDPSVCNNYCIRAASTNGHLEVVQLLKNYQNVNKKIKI
jgi:hypothetical protein